MMSTLKSILHIPSEKSRHTPSTYLVLAADILPRDQAGFLILNIKLDRNLKLPLLVQLCEDYNRGKYYKYQ